MLAERAVTTLTASQVLRQIQPAYGPTWDQAVRCLTEDPYEAAIVEQLRAVLRSGQHFDEPVVIDSSQVRDGMHRMVAFLLENAPTIRVADTHAPAANSSVFLEFDVAGLPVGDRYTDELDHLAGMLRSFPLPDGWFNCDVFGMVGGRFTMAVTWPHTRTDHLVAVLTARLAEFGVAVSGMSVELDED